MARRPRTTEQRLSLALERIYQVPFGQATWESALTAICDFLGAESADLTFSDPVLQQRTRWEQARLDTRTVEEYTRVYMAANWTEVHPRVPVALRMHQDQVVVDIDFWDASQRKQMMFFEEYYHPLVGCGECVMGCVRKTDDEPWVYVTPHFRSREPQARRTREHVRLLLPHIRHSINAEKRLRSWEREREALVDALTHFTEAVALLDRSGRVVRANRAAETIFRTADGLRNAADGRLILGTSDARAALISALARCATHCQPSQIQIAVPRARQHPLVLTLQPLPKENVGPCDAVALLFINDLDAQPEDRGTLLRRLYKLSSREAQLVQALAGGETLKRCLCALDTHRLLPQTG